MACHGTREDRPVVPMPVGRCMLAVQRQRIRGPCSMSNDKQTLLEQIAQEQRQPSPELQAKQQRLLDLLHKPKH